MISGAFAESRGVHCRSMEFLWALLFILWYELLSLPLRWASSGWRAPADVRRMLSRLAGPPLLALPLWFMAHGARGMLECGTGLAWLGLLAGLGLAAGLRQTRSAARLMAYEGGGRRGWLREAGLDAVMLALLLGFVAFRRWVPEMTTYQLDGSGAEKFANAMIYWSNWHARQMPPEDYWLAGTPLPYYYWGHFHWAWVARMGGFPPTLALNLAFAAMVTLTWTAGYLLARAARLPRGWAAGAALCVAWAGNPEAIRLTLPMLEGHGFKAPAETAGWWGWVKAAPQAVAQFLKVVLSTPADQWGYYDYWKPSRAIAGQNVVDEFPAFSAILGDFHSHHLALPWLTGWLALAVAGARWRGVRGAPGAAPLAPALREQARMNDLAWGLAWGAMGVAAVMTNLWNLPLIGLGTGVMVLLTVWQWLLLRQGWREAARQLACVAFFGLALWGGMRLLRSGAPLPLPKVEDAGGGLFSRLPIRKLPPELRTEPANMFGMWGLPVLALALAAAWSVFFPGGRRQRRLPAGNRRARRDTGNEGTKTGRKKASSAAGTGKKAGREARHPQERRQPEASAGAIPQAAGRRPASVASLALIIPGTLLILFQATPGGAQWPGGIAWLWVGVGLWVAGLMIGRRPWMPAGIGIALLGGCGVLAGLELVYLPDRFVGELVRYNSYFKFSYPVWPVLWVGGWAAARGVWNAGVPWPARWLGRAALLAILPCAAVYTVCAVPQRVFTSRYGDEPARRPTLDAFDFIGHRWINDAAGNRLSFAAEAPLMEAIRRMVPAGDRIAEGGWPEPPPPGESPAYQYQGRIASLAGYPVPVGWIHHEQQWRGETSYVTLANKNRAVDLFYRSATAEELRTRGQGLGVRWVVFGLREAGLYGPGSLAVLKAALPLAYANPEGRPEVYLFKFAGGKP